MLPLPLPLVSASQTPYSVQGTTSHYAVPTP